MLDDTVPTLPAGVLAGVETDPAQAFLVVQQPTGDFDEAALVARRGEHAVVPMADVLAGGGLVEGDHRETGGLGFEDHVAEGLRQAWEEEQVARGVVGGQGFAALDAAEQRFGQVPFEELRRPLPSPVSQNSVNVGEVELF